MVFERPPFEYATAPDGVRPAYVRFGEGERDVVLPLTPSLYTTGA